MASSRRKPGLDSRSSLLISSVTTAPASGRARGAGSARPREPAAVDALPQSSSDEDDYGEKEADNDDNDDNEDEPPAARRADMSRTTFQRPAAATAPAAATGRKGALAARVRPPRKTLLVALEKKRQDEAEAKKAEEAEAERARGTSGSRGTKRARPETAALEARKSPPSPPSSASQQGGVPSSSNSSSGGSGVGNGRGGGLFDQGRQRPPRSVGYSRRPALLVRDRATAKSSEASSRTGGKDTAKTKKAAREAEADGPRFIKPPPLTPEQDSSPPQAKFRHYKDPAGDSKDWDGKENAGVAEKPTFKWPVGVPRTVTAEADDQEEKTAIFRWPAGVPREPDADTDKDGNGGLDKASSTKTKTTTTTTKATKATKTTSLSSLSSLSSSSSPPPPQPPKTTANVPVGATLDSLKSRQKWRARLGQKQQKAPRRPAGAKEGTAALFGELELETDAGNDDGVEEVSPPEPRAVFKMPAGYDGRPAASGTTGTADAASAGADDDGRTLDDLLAADSDDGDSSDNTLPLDRPPATCPVCKADVDDEAVRALLVMLLPDDAAVAAAAAASTTAAAATTKSRGRSRETATAADLVRRHLLRFDDKLRFCEGHRQRASRAAWVARGYPAIDWAALGGRLRAHYGHVRRILEDETPSVFRAAMEGRGGDGAGGGGRGRKGADGAGQSAAVTPGYYGQKGLRVLTEAIVLEFAGLLRQRAVADRLIAARGSSQFVEAVLVPELAVQLIREDMGVGAAEAQRILWESGTIGEDVHGEERDVVMEEEEDDDDDVDDDDRW